MDIMKLIKLANIKSIKEVIIDDLWWNTEALRPIKDELEKAWLEEISYFAIKVCIAMMGKGDI